MLSGPLVVAASSPSPSQRLPQSEALSGPFVVTVSRCRMLAEEFPLAFQRSAPIHPPT